MTIMPWSRGQPVGDGPVVLTILIDRLPDGDEYHERQMRLFEAGRFAHVPVAESNASAPSLSTGFATEEIGLGSRRGDVDWQGRTRIFTADADMGLWADSHSAARRPGEPS
jgi:hypothetical protein